MYDIVTIMRTITPYINSTKRLSEIVASKATAILSFSTIFVSSGKTKRKGGTYMSTRGERIEVFQDTQNWIKSDPILSASIPTAKKNTTVFYEDDYPAFDSSALKDTIITVTKNRSYQAAMGLHKEDPDAKIAVMNFANAFHPGGGVVNGASAQEECLCRTSTLYPLLYRNMLRYSFYKHHHDLNTPKASDSLVYTEGVVICKTDTASPERMAKRLRPPW